MLTETSPHICITWSQPVNDADLFFAHMHELSLGAVFKDKGKYIVRSNSLPGKVTYLGTFLTESEAKQKLEEWIINQFNA